jgi:hypothetical protein
VNGFRRAYAALYPVWIGICLVLFLILRGAPDPSRREGRILEGEANARARAALTRIDRNRYGGYEAVHVAFAGSNEVGPPNRWVVLCDGVPHSGLRRAVVVELDARDGRPLVIRRPVR